MACLRTPVRNGRDDLDWNCQNWVGEALTELVEIGCVTEKERSAAIDEMVDVILDAELEDVSAQSRFVKRYAHLSLCFWFRVACGSLAVLELWTPLVMTRKATESLGLS